MRDETIAQLNQINRRFYLSSAEEFHRTRRGPWPGWRRLLELALPELQHRNPLRLLDVGCGNGRFQELLDGTVDYLGIDFSTPLLDRARRLTTSVRSSTFLELDLQSESLATRLSSNRYDLIVALGLLHHIPSHAARRGLLADCARLLAPGGLLAVSFWDFQRAPRLQDLLAPWSRARSHDAAPIDESDLEPGDHLLHFGQDSASVRYCHYSDPTERQVLISATGLTVRTEFLADGRERDLNHYVLLASAFAILTPRAATGG